MMIYVISNSIFVGLTSLQGQSKDLAESIIGASQKMRASMADGFKGFDEIAKPLYKAMTDDLARQQKRLGGDFAVAHAIATRFSRDYVRQQLGDQVVFFVLNLTQGCQNKRLKGRHGDSVDGLEENMGAMFKMYEPAARDEPNTHNVTIDEGDTPDMVVNNILAVIRSS